MCCLRLSFSYNIKIVHPFEYYNYLRYICRFSPYLGGTRCASIRKSSHLMMYNIIAVYPENHTKHKYTALAEYRMYIKVFIQGSIMKY
jgi:hypothetical protein